jgi:hypothetical protein
MPGPHEGNTVDVWEPAENVQGTGEVNTSTYTRFAQSVTCRLVPLSSDEKLRSGIDLSTSMKRLFIRANRLSNLTKNAVIVDKTAGTGAAQIEVWVVVSDVERYQAGPGSWQCVLERQYAPEVRADIRAAYP